MIHIKWFLLSTVFIYGFCAKAQVEHNFKMNPENTDCHQLPDNLHTLSIDSAVKLITSKKYRFTQEVTLSRYRSPRSLAFYSCDGTSGLMLAKETETKTAIYRALPKTVWDALINHSDPLEFYTNSTVKKYLLKLE